MTGIRANREGGGSKWRVVMTGSRKWTPRIILHYFSPLPLPLLFLHSPHSHPPLTHFLEQVQQEVLPPWLGLNLLQDHWQVQLQVACTDTAQSIRGGRSDLLNGGTEGTNDYIQQGSVDAEVTVRLL